MTRLFLALIASAALCACSGQPSPSHTAAAIEAPAPNNDGAQASGHHPASEPRRDPVAFVKALDGITDKFELAAVQPSMERQASLNAQISAVRKDAQAFGTLLDEGPSAECVRASMLLESNWRQIESLSRHGGYPGWRKAIAEDQKEYVAARQGCLNTSTEASPAA